MYKGKKITSLAEVSAKWYCFHRPKANLGFNVMLLFDAEYLKKIVPCFSHSYY